ncbi:MAG: DNA-3-methyladenine glycosylase, partial [Rhodothermales bacterium]|nr:DNA-3-methyladenine glycosylase [Rhodothermales bacterium]
EGRAGAVLVRAIEPVEGVEQMRERRPKARRPRDLTNGPGKLTQALGIASEEWHGADLTRPPLYFARDDGAASLPVGTSSRIGITRGVERPWRFFVRDHPFVSPGVPSDIARARKRAKRR